MVNLIIFVCLEFYADDDLRPWWYRTSHDIRNVWSDQGMRLRCWTRPRWSHWSRSLIVRQRPTVDQRLPHGDITNVPRQGVRSNNKRAIVHEDGECHNILWWCILFEKMYVNSSADDELKNIRCREARRDRYANMPLDKKAELNARKRENYHRRKAEKQSGGSPVGSVACFWKCMFDGHTPDSSHACCWECRL